MTELEELKLAYAECSRQRNELLNKLKSQVQPEKEPVSREQFHEHLAGPFYTAPTKREWVGLTDEDICACFEAKVISDRLKADARRIEAALKEKNT